MIDKEDYYNRKLVAGCWKIYECNFCYHIRIEFIRHTQPHCTNCASSKMRVKEWVV